eukprot:TRINITY_DN80334_c0_g1_i1.p1 TRINITY_DN80334_c0_g1~~TRINITY_DN80334_c0_g1_i1.p1  ORF type:complete len:676 (-),score=130.95 TRINITY_DN80334_c0_g1_i1:56-2029(-)
MARDSVGSAARAESDERLITAIQEDVQFVTRGDLREELQAFSDGIKSGLLHLERTLTQKTAATRESSRIEAALEGFCERMRGLEASLEKFAATSKQERLAIEECQSNGKGDDALGNLPKEPKIILNEVTKETGSSNSTNGLSDCYDGEANGDAILPGTVPAPVIKTTKLPLPKMQTVRQRRGTDASTSPRRGGSSGNMLRSSLFGQDDHRQLDSVVPHGDCDMRPSASMICEHTKTDVVDRHTAEDRRRWTQFRLCCAKFVENPWFDYVFGVFIVLNALSIGFQADYMAKKREVNVPLGMRISDSLFCLVFAAELGLRMVTFQLKFFSMRGWQWNVFDCTLVMMQVFEEVFAIAEAISTEPADQDRDGTGNFSFLRIIRVLRLIRVVRLARVLRLVRQLRTLVCSIGASLQSLAWTVLLISFMIYIVGVYFTQLVSNHLYALNVEQLNSDNTKDMIKYFGQLGTSCLSLFQAISGGVDWDDMLRPMFLEISPFVAPLFTLYIAFAILAMLNVVTGVFVESALQSSSADREEHLVKQLSEIFEELDHDRNGLVTEEEFELTLNKPETVLRLTALEIDPVEAQSLFRLLDIDGCGAVNAEFFVLACLRLRGGARSIDLCTMMFEQKKFHRRFEHHKDLMEQAVRHLCPDLGGEGCYFSH